MAQVPYIVHTLPDTPTKPGGQNAQEVNDQNPLPTYSGADPREVFRAMEESVRAQKAMLAEMRRTTHPFWTTTHSDEPYWAQS